MGALGSCTDVISYAECGCEDASEMPGDSPNGEGWVCRGTASHWKVFSQNSLSKMRKSGKAGHLPALSPFSASPEGNCPCFGKRYPRERESQPPSRAEHQHPGCASQITLWGTGSSPPRAPARGSTGLWDRRRESAGDAAVTQPDGPSAKGPHRLFLVGL